MRRAAAAIFLAMTVSVPGPAASLAAGAPRPGPAIPAPVAAAPTTRHPGITAPAEIGIDSQPFHVLSASTARFSLRLPATAVTTGKDAGTVEFLLHRRVATRDSFRAIADRFAEPGVIDAASVSMRRTSTSQGVTSVEVQVNVTQQSKNDLFLPQPGIYPLTIRAIDAAGTVIASTLTFLDRRDPLAGTGNAQVSVFAALAAPSSHTPDGNIAVDDVTRVIVQQFIDFLDSVQVPLTLQVQPELVEALSSSPDPYDRQLFDRLRTVLNGRAVVSATYLPVDLGALVRDGLGDEFAEQLTLGEQTLARVLPGQTVHTNTWVAGEPLDRESIALLKSVGISSILLMPTANLGVEREKPIGHLSRPSGKGNESIAVMSVDDALANTIESSNENSARLGIRIAAETLAQRDDLLAAGILTDGIRLVVSSSNGDVLDVPSLASAVRNLNSTPGLTMVDLGGLQAVDARYPATVFPSKSDRTLGGLQSAIRQARTELNAVSSMLPQDDPRRLVWAQVLAGASSTATDSPSEYVEGLRSELRRLKGSVTLVTPDTITLSSRTGSIRLQIRNEQTTSLFVKVALSSPKVKFSGAGNVVELLPGSTTDVKIPVRARTNGRFPVNVRVLTPEGRLQVVSPAVINARVTAVAGLGQVVSFTLLLVLFAWWWNSRRKTQRERRAATTVSGQ